IVEPHRLDAAGLRRLARDKAPQGFTLGLPAPDGHGNNDQIGGAHGGHHAWPRDRAGHSGKLEARALEPFVLVASEKYGAARMEPLFCNCSSGSDRAKAAGDENRSAFLNAIIEVDGVLVDHADAA